MAWATPNTMDHLPQRSEEALKRQAETTRKGRNRPANLREQVNPAAVNIYKQANRWPTPTGMHAQRGNHEEPLERYQQRVMDYQEGKAKGKPGMSLGVAVRWPTPTVSESGKIGNQPNHGQRGLSNHPEIVGNTLRDKLEKSGRWPTPSTRDHKGTYLPKSLIRKDGKIRDQLPEAAAYTGGHHVQESSSMNGKQPGLLNASWVEQLMGYPTGWTDSVR